MNHQEFITLVKHASQLPTLPEVLAYFKNLDDQEIAEAAQSLTGQFSIAEIDGDKRIYHVTVEPNEQGVDTEYVEHIMNEGEDSIVFIAWFFNLFFDVKSKDVYAAAGRTYQQPKRG